MQISKINEAILFYLKLVSLYSLTTVGILQLKFTKLHKLLIKAIPKAP